MAKMFFTIEETAAKLGIIEEEVRELASSGKLQVFRDRDKMMFKRDQVEGLVTSEVEADMSGTSIPLQDSSSGDTGMTGTAGDTAGTSQASQGSGVNVFETDEVDAIDPKAKTQVTQRTGADDELMLESVGSGSGLLDLTRKSDDTSVGAELLDEIYPGDSGADAKVPGASGTFETAVEVDAAEGEIAAAEAGAPVGVPIALEPYDAAGSGLSVGFLIGATISLVLTMIVSIYAVAGVGNSMTSKISESTGSVLMYTGILIVVTIVFGTVGFFVGKSRA